MINKRKIGLELIIVSMVIIAGGLAFTSCNNEICPAYSLTDKSELFLNNAYGSRYIQSPFTDQERVLRIERILKSHPEEAFVR